MTYIVIKDTEHLPSYYLPGITPGHEMSLLVSMARDLPLKKPLPEPGNNVQACLLSTYYIAAPILQQDSL